MKTNNIWLVIFISLFLFSCNQKNNKEQNKINKKQDKVSEVNEENTSFIYTDEQAKNIGIRGKEFNIFSLKLLDTIPKLKIDFPNIEIKTYNKDTILLYLNYEPKNKDILLLRYHQNGYYLKKVFDFPKEYEKRIETYYFQKNKVIKYVEDFEGDTKIATKVYYYLKNKKIIIDVEKNKLDMLYDDYTKIPAEFIKNTNIYDYVFDENNIIVNLKTLKTTYKEWRIYEKTKFSYFWNVFIGD